ncbi:MAG: MarR family transcriptional regulator [Dehalogenimonas sp.]
MQIDLPESEVAFGRHDKHRLAELKHEQLRAITIQLVSNDLRPLGITPEKAAIILQITATSKPLTPVSLTKMLRRNSSAISKILKRMVKDGTIRLVKDAINKHLLYIELTQKGKELSCDIDAILAKREMAFSVLSDHELDTFITLIDKVDHHAMRLLKLSKL